MKFLIQHNMINPIDLQKIKEAISVYPHEFVGVIPFSDEITSDEHLIGVEYIPHGSTAFIMRSATLGFTGLHFDLTRFNYEIAAKNRDDMLNSEMIAPLHECVVFLETRPALEEWFTRPSEDLKQYSGQVMAAGECAVWLRDRMECACSGSYQLGRDTMIVLAQPKPIIAEWRWFIVGGQIISGSMYRKYGELYKKAENDKSIIDEAQQLANKWLPDACCVMDTAVVDGIGTPKVIEFNCINASGFYDNDIPAIFTALWEYHLKNQ